MQFLHGWLGYLKGRAIPGDQQLGMCCKLTCRPVPLVLALVFLTFIVRGLGFSLWNRLMCSMQGV